MYSGGVRTTAQRLLGKILKLDHLHKLAVRYVSRCASTSSAKCKHFGMGINALLPFLKDVTVTVNIKSLNGRTAAVDASCWIHRALSTCYEQNGNDSRQGFIVYIYVIIIKISSGFHTVPAFIVLDCKASSSHILMSCKRAE